MEKISMSGAEKAAVIFLALEADAAARLFQELDDLEMKEISHAMAYLGKVPAAMTEMVVLEFAKQINETIAVIGNFSNTRNFLRRVLSDDKVNMLLEELSGPIGKNIWDKLTKVSPKVLANYLKDEYPQTIAFVMTKLPPAFTAKIFVMLNSALATEVVSRMLSMSAVNNKVVDSIEKSIRNDFIGNVQKVDGVTGDALVAEIFNVIDRVHEERLMEALEKRSHKLAAQVRRLMFSFEDVLRIDAIGLQLLLRTVDRHQLALALKGANEKIIVWVKENMTQRAYKMLSEEVDSVGDVKSREVEEARKNIAATAKVMLNAGTISLIDAEPDVLL